MLNYFERSKFRECLSVHALAIPNFSAQSQRQEIIITRQSLTFSP